jgi:hypothetical protein
MRFEARAPSNLEYLAFVPGIPEAHIQDHPPPPNMCMTGYTGNLSVASSSNQHRRLPN